MFALECKICHYGMWVNPPVYRQKRTRCPGCGKMQLLSDYYHSDSNSFSSKLGRFIKQGYNKEVGF